MTSFMKDAFYSYQILRMLQSCYKAKCVEVPAAKDCPDVKGNAWIKFHDLCFGGGEPEHGLVKEFPVIDRPTKLKKKSFPFGNMLLQTKPTAPKMFLISVLYSINCTMQLLLKKKKPSLMKGQLPLNSKMI